MGREHGLESWPAGTGGMEVADSECWDVRMWG